MAKKKKVANEAQRRALDAGRKIRAEKGSYENSGRPTKYKPEYCQQLIDYMESDGEPVKRLFAYEGDVTEHTVGTLPNFFEGFAKKIGISTSNLAEWRKRYPEFQDAYKKAKDIQLDRMVKGTISGTYNSAGAIFALKNMHGWRDKQEVDANVHFEPPIFVKKYTDLDEYDE